MKAAVLTLAAVAAVGLTACDDAEPTAVAGPEPIAAIAVSAGFTELVGALQYVDAELDAGLVELFQNGTDPYTVFAPTNAAFEGLYGLLTQVLGTPIDEITDVPAPVVLDVLLYHVAAGRQSAGTVLPASGERAVSTLLGETFGVRANGSLRDGLSGLRADATIATADIAARNGIIHVIDQVIVPPSVVASITGTAAARAESEASPTDGGRTEALPAPGPLAQARVEMPERSPRAPGEQSIAALAIANGNFTQLVAALQYVDAELETGLVDLFSAGTDQYTVFAPTDAAFTGLYALLSDVLGTEIDAITEVPASVVLAVLQYHVTEGRRSSNSVLPRRGERVITTLLAETFSVRVDGTIRDGLTGVRGADAAITAPNLSASNGVIHVIDQVIVPPSVVAALVN